MNGLPIDAAECSECRPMRFEKANAGTVRFVLQGLNYVSECNLYLKFPGYSIHGETQELDTLAMT